MNRVGRNMLVREWYVMMPATAGVSVAIIRPEGGMKDDAT